MDRPAECAPVVKRLIALMAKGYELRQQDFAESDKYLSLEHPAKWQKVKEKSLFLYDDGSVMGGPRADDTCLLIDSKDSVEFQRLLAATPKATWWERNSAPFHSVWGLAILAGLLFAGVKLIDFVWKAISGTGT